MSTSRSTTAVSCPVTSAIAVARLDVRKVLPDPPLDEKTDRILPRVTRCPSACVGRWPSAGSAPRRSRAPRHRGARRSPGSCRRRRGCPRASLPAAGRSRCGRGPGRSPCPGPGARRTRPGRARRAPSPRGTAPGRRLGWKALISSSSAAVADCTQPTSSGPTSIALASCWRNDCGVPTATTLASVIRSLAPSRSSSGTVEASVSRPSSFSGVEQTEPHEAVLLREHEGLRVLRAGGRA